MIIYIVIDNCCVNQILYQMCSLIIYNIVMYIYYYIIKILRKLQLAKFN